MEYSTIRNSIAAAASIAGALCVYKAIKAKTGKAKALWAVAAVILLGGGGLVLMRSGPMGSMFSDGANVVAVDGVVDAPVDTVATALPDDTSLPLLPPPSPTPPQPDVVVIDPSAHVNVNPALVDGGLRDPAQTALNKEAAVRMLKAWKLPAGVDRATLQAMFGFEDDDDAWGTPDWGRTAWVIPMLKNLYEKGGTPIQNQLHKFVDGLSKSVTKSGTKYWIELNPPTTPGDEFPARIQLTEFVDFVNSQRG